jgi:3-hydroxyisobutyrate dehydrogenase
MKVGFAGLGAIGTPMADRLATVHELKVWNRTGIKTRDFVAAHHAVKAAATPRELAESCDAVVTCLATSGDLEAICEGPDGLLAGMTAGSILIDCTSGDPAISRRLAERLASRGVAFVDAPVSGGPPMAAKGTLAVMCGGSEADVARAAQVIAPFAAKVVRMGPVGSGHAVKAVNNALLAVNILAVGEGLVALAKLGVAPRDAVEILNASSGRSYVTEALVPERVLNNAWPQLFRLALLEKDIGIAHDIASNVGTADPVLANTREVYRELRAELGETADYLDSIKRAESLAGVTLRG